MNGRKVLSSVLVFVLVIALGGIFSRIHEIKLYPQHQQLAEYRRLHPNIIASEKMLQAVSIGHNTSLADILWIQLMQFIGDNIVTSEYTKFSHKILQEIQSLSPRFSRAYELDLLLFPMLSPADTPEREQEKKQQIETGLISYEAKIPELCDMKKVMAISALAYGTELWSHEELKNPCLSGMIPYYMATHYDTDLQDYKKAAEYYKIASMHDDAPIASRFLGIIAFSTSGNFRDGALSFALIASSEYDEDPWICGKFTDTLVADLSERTPWTPEWISAIERSEKQLVVPKDANNPMVAAGNTCYSWVERSIKQVYLGYITQITQNLPEVTTAEGLLERHLIDHIPTIQTQSGFSLRKQDGNWQYYFPIQ